MNELKHLVIHCTDTPEGRPTSSADIRDWHIRGNGWTKVGYSDMFHLDGTLENLIPFNQDNTVDPWEVSNGARGLNGTSRHIVYVGGKQRLTGRAIDTRTEGQKEALATYVRYMVLRHPNIKVMGHYQAASARGKTCPNFDVPCWLQEIGIPSINIY